MKLAPMWKLETEEGNIFYHYSDKVRAGENPELKWVVMDRGYFIGTCQAEDNFAIAVYDTEGQAEEAITKTAVAV